MRLAITKIALGILLGCSVYSCTQNAVSHPEKTAPDVARLDSLLNGWHRNAANANTQAYFGLMDSSFMFLGTDPGERWTKSQFFSFCKPHFAKGKGWDFTPTKRYWSYSSDSTVAWFDESLDTWMRDCRGSGVFTYHDNQWWLQQYNLAVTIENELIEDYITLKDGYEQ